MSFTIGSLFDGSGGFPLAAFMCGGEPKWAAEIEPYPIAVTKTRFPYMKHLGSVTDINGGEIEPVDVITFGSPCQDLSVAGKRAGLKHEDNGDEETTRSGLFMEAVRIIKEMREATNGVYPRIALWENVPGAFSSNKGEDFRIVLEELIKICEPTAVMPAVPQRGWAYADHYCGDGWSIAYRVLDAQYWGVPQRRKRIYLVLDLGGECTGEVLFEREGLRGYFEEGRTPWQSTTSNAERGTGAADRATECITLEPGIAAREGGHIYEGVCGTLRANAGDNQMAVAYCGNFLPQKKAESMAWSTEDICCTLHNGTCAGHQNAVVFESAGFCPEQSAKTRGIGYEEENAPTLRAGVTPAVVVKALPFDTTQVTSPMNYSNPKWGDPCHPSAAGAHPPAVVCKCWDARGNGDGANDSTITGDHNNRVTDYTSLVCEPIPIHDQATRFSGKRGDNHDGKGNGLGVGNPGDSMNTLTSGDRHAVAYAMQGFGDDKESDVASGLKARDYKDATDLICGVDCRNFTESPELYPTLQAKPNGGQSLNYSGAVRIRYVVRRLTPTECARLQGFPDGWGHPDHKDDFTEDEYRFWLHVRNTHAYINGKAVKDYTKKQMLTWYNKLHTDSSEYKMWGNGVALPCVLYVMQGIADVLK